MAKVIYNGATFKDHLIPNMTKSQQNLVAALDTNINFAEEDCGWSNVKTKLSDTCNKTTKYIEWANTFMTKMDNAIINNDNALANIKIADIKSITSKVK